MQVFNNLQNLQNCVSQWRQNNETIAFVPTMGNLHEGHLSLVKKAKENAKRVIVSIYVNPMQFGANEDFDSYPRTIDADIVLLEEYSVDGLFLPTTDLIYPQGAAHSTRVEVPGLSNILCGEFRPGHFVGVTTVVCKLINMVMPDIMLLGQKDYQQLTIIRRMAQDLFFDVKIISGDTVREPDGLAKSSRNQYLGLDERELAPMLYKTMCESVKLAKSGENLAKIEFEAMETLNSAGFKCEYFEFREAESLHKPQLDTKEVVLLSAAYLGLTRLIDNIVTELH